MSSLSIPPSLAIGSTTGSAMTSLRSSARVMQRMNPTPQNSFVDTPFTHQHTATTTTTTTTKTNVYQVSPPAFSYLRLSATGEEEYVVDQSTNKYPCVMTRSAIMANRSLYQEFDVFIRTASVNKQPPPQIMQRV